MQRVEIDEGSGFCFGVTTAIRKAEELHRELPNSIILKQFENPANPLAHLHTTAEEIWRDADGKVDIVIAGVGTGGTITGIGRNLKKKNPEIRIVAVEPFRSQVLAGKPAGSHAIQGLGANFVPRNFDRSVIDVIYPVGDIDAVDTARKLATDEGILCGISSGAAISIPFFFFGKKFFKCKCFYIEVFDRINQPTKSGKFCYKYADKFYVQWDEMKKVYPKAEVLGRIF